MRRQGTALVLAAFLLMLMVMSATARQIEVWTGALSDSDITWMQTNLAPKFAKAKGIDVVFKRISGQEMNDQLNNKQGPDVLMYSGGGATRGAMGYLQPLNRYFDRWADRQKISANVLVYDAKKNLYLIPTDVTFYGVSYNKDAFKRAGVSTTALPSSWEALRSADPALGQPHCAYRHRDSVGYWHLAHPIDAVGRDRAFYRSEAEPVEFRQSGGSPGIPGQFASARVRP